MLSKTKTKLISIASQAIVADPPALGGRLSASFNGALRELIELLSIRNGFFAFESALHVFPSSASAPLSLENWNRNELWRLEYPNIPADAVFFAEDIFGGQFAIQSNAVTYMEPETGRFKRVASSFEEFVRRLLTDFRTLTGHRFAHDRQSANGPLGYGQRLAGKIPFVLGGAYDLENFYAARQPDLMRMRGHIAKQIAHLPEGAKVKLKTT